MPLIPASCYSAQIRMDAPASTTAPKAPGAEFIALVALTTSLVAMSIVTVLSPIFWEYGAPGGVAGSAPIDAHASVAIAKKRSDFI